MIQQFILFAFLLSISFLQTGYPKLDDLQPLTVQNVGALKSVASIGSDTPEDVIWSPDGKTLAAVSSGQVVLYNRADMLKPFLKVQRPSDEAIDLENEFLIIGENYWNTPGNTESVPSADKIFTGPDKKWFISGSTEDGQVTIDAYDTISRKETSFKSGISGELVDAVFSPESRYVALKFTEMSDSWSGRQLAQLWDLDAGKLITKLDQYYGQISQMAFYANGRLLVTVSKDDDYGEYDDIRVWDVRSGEQLQFNKDTSYAPVRFSPDQKLMVYAVNTGLLLWDDWYMGLMQYKLPDQEGTSYAELRNPTFSPDSTKLFTQYYNQIFVWDVDSALKNLVPAFSITPTQNAVPRWLLENNSMIRDYTLSTDGSRLAVQNVDDQVRIWDLTQDPPVVKQVLSNINSVQMSPDFKWAWGDTAGLRNKVLIDANTSELLQKLPSDARLDPRWQYAAYWSEGVVSVVDLGQKQTTHLYPLPDYLGDVEYQEAKQGRAVFTSGNRMAVYDLLSGEDVFHRDEQFYHRKILSPSGQILLSLSNKGVQISKTDHPDDVIFELNSAIEKPIFSLLPDEKTLVYITPSDTYSFSNSRVSYSHVQLWDILTGKQLAEYTIEGNIQAFTTNQDGSSLAIGSADGYGDVLALLYMVDLAHPQKEPLRFEIPVSQFTFFDQLNFSPNGQYLAMTTDSQEYGDGPTGHFYEVMVFTPQRLRDPATFEVKEAFIIPGVRSPVFSPNGQLLFTSGAEDVYDPTAPVKVHLWDLKTQTELSAFESDTLPAFSPDGHLAAAHDETGTNVYAVDALQKGESKPFISIVGREGKIKNLAFKPDGKALYLVESSRVRVYGVP
ncbi:MAG: hypothetical protein H0X30_21595 [Anaerolineae bacterium]|nr:hypothetical protein [Anaerolineae bacterium]